MFANNNEGEVVEIVSCELKCQKFTNKSNFKNMSNVTTSNSVTREGFQKNK